MKRNTSILLCAGLLAVSSFANAAGQLAPVQVQGSMVNCTPPSDNAVCSAWHAQIRRNFTAREIGLLFGARTSYPNYNASYDSVKARYDNLQATFAASYLGNNATVASK